MIGGYNSQKPGFVVAKTTPHSINQRDRRRYLLHMEIAVASVLAVILLGIWISPHLHLRSGPREIRIVHVPSAMETVPITRQGSRRPPPRPSMPAIPVEADFETEMDDLTIDFFDANLLDLPDMPVGFGVTSEAVAMGPRLIREVFPAVPERVKQRGIRGELTMSLLVGEDGKVRDVQILSNTTSVEQYFRVNRTPDAERQTILAALPAVINRLAKEAELTPAHDAMIAGILREHGVNNAADIAESIRINWPVSQLIVNATIEAAFKYGYLPARKGEEPVEQRTVRTLTIDYSNK